MKRTSKELKRIARDILNNRYTIPMGAFITASLIPTVIEIPFSMSAGDQPSTAQFIITALADFLILLIWQVLRIGVARVHLNMTRGEAFSLKNVFDPFRHSAERFFGAAFFYQLLMLLLCAPMICGTLYFYYTDITASSVSLLILTILVSAALTAVFLLNFSFLFLLLLDHPQMKLKDALLESRRLMKGNKMRLFYIFLSFLGWGVLIFCSLGIVLLWASPYMTQTLITFYLDRTGELDRIPVRDYTKDSQPFSTPFF